MKCREMCKKNYEMLNSSIFENTVLWHVELDTWREILESLMKDTFQISVVRGVFSQLLQTI